MSRKCPKFNWGSFILAYIKEFDRNIVVKMYVDEIPS